MVHFACGVTQKVQPEDWLRLDENDSKKAVASRRQVPLDLAYAMTIHRAQGMSLDRVHVDFSGAFGPAMCYVALSRCRTLQGLTVKNLTAAIIKAHPDALAFKERLDQEREHHLLKKRRK